MTGSESARLPATAGESPVEAHAVASGVTVEALAGWMAALAEVDRDLTDTERVDLVRGLEDLKSAAAAAQARVTADLDVSRHAERASAGVPTAQRGRGIGAEVALARRVSPVRGGQHLGLATALVREMPCTLAALTTGELSEWRATLLVRESACLSVADRGAFDEQLCADPSRFAGWGDGRLVAEAKRVAARLDAGAVVRRNRRAQSERCVSIRPAPDTMSYVTGLLPVAQGVAVHAALSREADALRATGDDRSRGQIMADTLVERVTGQEHAGDVRLEVQLVMTDAALLGGDDEPAHVPGYGTVPAAWARDLIASASQDERSGADQRAPGDATPPGWSSPRDVGAPAGGGVPAAGKPGGSNAAPSRADGAGNGADVTGTGPPVPGAAGGCAVGSDPDLDVWVRRLYTSPSGTELVAMDSRARRAPAGLARFITARDRTCRTPWCDAPIRHIDHVLPHAQGGPTSAGNLQGLCEACNYAKQAPGWSARVASDGSVSPSAAPPSAVQPGTVASRQPPASASGPLGLGPPGSPSLPPGIAPPDEHEVVTTTPTGHRYTSYPPPPVGAPWHSRTRPPRSRVPIDLMAPGASPVERHLIIQLAA